MGKKGVLLDNGKVAQSSMALYWKAGQKRGGGHNAAKPQEEREEGIEERAGSAMERWKLHKQKMIQKIYQKPQKKDSEAEQRQIAEQQQRLQEQMERELLEKEMNKNKPVHIPGFKDTAHLQSKRQYETVMSGNQDGNKLILPAGYQDLTQDDIIQMLREKRAKRQIEKSQRQNEEKVQRVHVSQNDFLYNKQQRKEPEKEPPKAEEKIEEKSLFKSQLLQRIEKGESIVKKEAPPTHTEEAPKEVTETAHPLKFVPRALWKK